MRAGSNFRTERDSVVCLEAAGDICVTEPDKERLVREWFRVLRPGGHVGFSDLTLSAYPSRREDKTLRAVLYHSGAELVSDWPAIFARQGFHVLECRDIIEQTLPTWRHARAVYSPACARGRASLRQPARSTHVRPPRANPRDPERVGTVPSLCAREARALHVAPLCFHCGADEVPARRVGASAALVQHRAPTCRTAPPPVLHPGTGRAGRARTTWRRSSRWS